MKHRSVECRIVGALGASVLIVAVMASVVPAQGDAPPDYYYSYFKQQVHLGLNTSEVAIRNDSPLEDAGPEAALRTAGIALEDTRRMAVNNWSRATVPNGHRTASGIEAAVATLAGNPAIDFVSPVFEDSHGDPLIITPDLLIGFVEDVPPKQAEAFLESWVDGVIKDRDFSNMPGVYRMTVNSRNGFEVLSLANTLATQPEIKFAESDMMMTARRMLIPNDNYFNTLWGLHNTGQSGGTADMDMDAVEAWDVTTGDPSIEVLILDDGIQQDHPDLNQVTGWDFTGHGTDGGPHNECDNHGTAVAGCVSAVINNSIGVVGSAPGCKVKAAKYSVANTPCDGAGSFLISWLVSAINWSQTSGARVTNNSNGFDSSSTVTTKYETTRDAGVVHFAASGNESDNSPSYPANLPTVVAVGAVNRHGNRASFSNWGPGLAFSAPGVSVGTTDRTGTDGEVASDYDWVDGTSFASPYAAGVAALILSVDDSLTPDEVEDLMEETCTDLGDTGYDTEYGWGLVNAYAALSELATGACCLADGSCVEVTSDECLLYPGIARPAGTVCPPDPACEPVDGVMTLEAAATGVAPAGSTKFTVYLEEIDDLMAYQATLVITRTSGSGTLYVDCPEGVQVDETRADYVFQSVSSLPVAGCEFLEIVAISMSDSVDVGADRKYLGDYTLTVSPDATPGSTFEVALVDDPASTFLRDSGSYLIPFRISPSVTLSVTTGALKSRYVSFIPEEPGAVALQLEMISSTLFPGSSGVVGWIDEPNGDSISRVSSVPLFRVWSEAMIHVADCEIAPATNYEISGTTDGVVFGDPIPVATADQPVPKFWADIVGPFDGSGWGPPNGLVSMDDIMAMVQKFQASPTAPDIKRADLDPEIPNLILNMTDIMRCVQGFEGQPYPFSDPISCP